jgi:hypothetical protein
MPVTKGDRVTKSSLEQLVAGSESFPILVHRIVELLHDGTLLQATGAAGMSYTTLWRWERGRQRRADFRLVKQFCDEYGLDFEAVSRLVERDMKRHALGEPVPVPDIRRRRGPRPRGGSSTQPLAGPPTKQNTREPDIDPREHPRIGQRRASPARAQTVYDSLKDLIGVADSGGARLSEDTGKRFRELLSRGKRS